MELEIQHSIRMGKRVGQEGMERVRFVSNLVNVLCYAFREVMVWLFRLHLKY